MKLSKQTLTKIGLIAISLAIIIPSTLPAKADQYDNQINNLQRQVAQQQKEANDLHARANGYRSKVDELQAQMAVIQTQIILNEAKNNKLSAEIDQAKEDLTKQKAIFDENIRSIYKEGELNSIEVLASSDNFSDFVNKQEYSQKVKDKVAASLAKIKAIKEQLDKQQAEVAAILQEQKAQRAQLASSKQEADSLLALAQQDASAADSKVQASNAQIASLQSAQAASWAKIQQGSSGNGGTVGAFVYKNWSGNTYCGGGYPARLCGAAQDSLTDEWQLYNRECVSYAAWAAEYRFGGTVNGFHGSGMAYEWPWSAPRYSGALVNTSPSRGSVMVIPDTMIGGVGHVAVVESVNGDWVHVSQYNWGLTGAYSEMDVKLVPGLKFVHF